MLTPGPDHPIRLEPAPRRWRAAFNNHVIADTHEALVLRESDLPAVIYFPRQDVAMEYMGHTAHHSHCPYKGDASYYTLTMDGDILENVAWSYESPFDAVSPIAGRIAFYADRIEIYEVTDPRVEAHPPRRSFAPPEEVIVAQTEARAEAAERAEIDEVIQHTDAGGGVSQREHWPANVEVPGSPEGGVR